MKTYPLAELIKESQYHRTKPDPYVMQKGVKEAVRRLQGHHRKLFLGGVIVSLLIVGGLLAIGYGYKHYASDRKDTVVEETPSYKSKDVRKQEYIQGLKEIFPSVQTNGGTLFTGS